MDASAPRPRTEPGRRFCETLESHVEAFRARAADHDVAGSFPRENFEDLAKTGVMGAFVPESLGGMGLGSVHDWALGLAVIARGDASTAIALNMHLAVSRNVAGAFHAAEARSDRASADRNGGMLRAVAAGELVIAATATEPGTDFLRPRTTATPTEDGYRIDGRKIFVTLSPIANVLAIGVRVPDAQGDRIGFAFVPRATPGIVPQDDWDALGMRASGSQSIVFENCRVPTGSVQIAGVHGRWSPGLLMGRTLGNLTLCGAFLGIAERARELAIAGATRETKDKHGGSIAAASGVQHRVGELEIELHAARAALTSTASRLDDLLAASPAEGPDLATAHACMADYQCAKWTVNQNAISIVSKAMDVCGGSAFLANHELSRLYRDVRAGPFMQPFSPTEAREYLGQVALGRPPEG